ncbi:MAG: hypothetical protein AB7U82_03120 [Blastocatellales bacterium]
MEERVQAGSQAVVDGINNMLVDRIANADGGNLYPRCTARYGNDLDPMNIFIASFLAGGYAKILPPLKCVRLTINPDHQS